MKFYLRKIKGGISCFFKRNYTRIYSITHPIKKKILFFCSSGKQYADSQRAICEKMHKLYPDFQLVWVLNDIENKYGVIPSYVKIVANELIVFCQELATSMCFITNEGSQPSLYKRKNQFFIQTWHGDRPIKKILYEVWDERGETRPIPIIDNKITDLCIAASDEGESMYHTAFHYYGEIMRIGMPRNDKLVIEDENESPLIRQRIGLNPNVKVLCYAPTLRSKDSVQTINVDLVSVINCLERKGEDWICLLRSHPKKSFATYSYDKNIFVDVSDYPDMADILLITDMLITDYSSCAGDFVLRRKPVILAMFDREEYNKNARSFVIDIKKSNYLIAENQSELEKIIDTYTEQDYIENCDKIIRYFNITESGKSAEAICHRINDFYLSHNNISG